MASSHHTQGDGPGGGVIENLREAAPPEPTAAIADLVPELLSTIGDGLLVIRSLSESLVFHNEPARRLLGFSAQAFTDTTWQNLSLIHI